MERSGRINSRIGLVLSAAAWTCGGCGDINWGGLPDGQAAQVYLLRGLWDVFSKGLNTLSVELQERGIAADAISSPEWPRIAEEIEKRQSERSRETPLIFVGHSYGADDAIRLCKALESKGIEVELLLLLDATNPPAIPANVARCVHYYLPNELGAAAPDVFSGNPVEAEEGNARTVVVNVIVSEREFGPEARGIDHFNLESAGVLHAAVMEEILRVLDTPRDRAG